MKTATTGTDALRALRADNPAHRFALSRSGNVVAVHAGGEWVPCAALACTGEWVRVWGLPLLNGAPAVAPSDWIE